MTARTLQFCNFPALIVRTDTRMVLSFCRQASFMNSPAKTADSPSRSKSWNARTVPKNQSRPPALSSATANRRHLCAMPAVGPSRLLKRCPNKNDGPAIFSLTFREEVTITPAPVRLQCALPLFKRLRQTAGHSSDLEY
jgi:hypothetical protein